MKTLLKPVVSGRRVRSLGFSLLEIMIACAIFFMVAFAILELVTRSLAAARSLQQRDPDPGLIAAEVMARPILEEGTESGDFEEHYPDMFPGYRWELEIRSSENETNIMEMFITVFRNSSKGPTMMQLPLRKYDPGSWKGSAF